MLKVYQSQGLNVFKDSVSLPRLTQKQIFGALKEDEYFTTFHKDHSHIYKQLRDGIVGGPSIVFNRYQERDVTKIRPGGGGGEICKKVLGYDANALYLSTMAMPQPTGPYRLRERVNGFQKHSKHDKNFIFYSQKSIKWIQSLERERGIEIRHAENSLHGEKRVGNFYVDGFYEPENIIFEFLGCYFHGCPRCDPAAVKNKTENWQPSLDRLQKFRDKGYTVEYITECQWKEKEEKENNEKTKTTSGSGGPLPATVKDIENGILTGEIFGIVKCNLRVPPGELTSYFSDFPPIFKNSKIDLKDVGPHMEEYSRSIGRKKGVEMSLISSMFGDGLVILTELFKKYIEIGLVCTDVEWVLEYNPQCVFRWFVDKVSDDRRRADLDDEMAIIGETSKTSGNAAYGYCAICKSRHNTVTFCEQKDLSKHVRDPFFKSVEQLGG